MKTLVAKGDFSFTFLIEKAVPSVENDEMIITGVASTLNVDHDNERMAEEALVSMANIINTESVPLRYEHDKSDSAIIGNVFKSLIDERKQLWIKARLDKTHSVSPILHSTLKQGLKLGLSVGGRVKNAVKEFSEAVGGMVKTFYDVALDEVSVTTRPANYDSWLIAKSVKTKEENVEPFYKSAFYKEFLFENQQLDYLQAFAKSIPDKAWEINNIHNMKKENIEEVKKSSEETTTTETAKAESTETTTETATKAESTETTEETTKGYASKDEVTALKSMMEKGFDAISNLLTKMTETTEETSTKSETETTTETATKAEEAEDSEEKSIAAKQERDEDSNHPSEEETEKAETETDTAEKYELKGMDKAISTIKNITNRLSKTSETAEALDQTNPEKEKSETEETTTKSQGTSIDAFADSISSMVSALEEKFAKSGKSVPGLRTQILDVIKNDTGIQEEITKMMKEPGFKKSVSMGVPYMTTKDGRRFSLVATEVGEPVAKSAAKTDKSFKDIYKSEYSSVTEE